MDDLPGISWRSFWDLATPEDVAQILREMFGDDAAKIAAENGLVAKSDDREEDFQFWSTVFRILHTTH